MYHTAQEKQEIITQHLEMTLARGGECQAVTNFRKHLIWYTKGLCGSAEFRRMASKVSSHAKLFNIMLQNSSKKSNH